MEYLKIITTEDRTIPEEGCIAINTDLPGYPVLEYRKGLDWIPIDNLETSNRMARFDDLYTFLHAKDWGIGPRFFISSKNQLCMSSELQDSVIPVLGRDGIKLSELLTIEDTEKFDNIYMNKEIDFYYNYLVSTRDILEKSSVIDLFEYPVEYGNILNLSELPIKKDNLRYTKSEYIIRLCIGYVIDGFRKTKNITFIPWTLGNEDGEEFSWSEFTQSLDGEVLVEFHDGCIRLFPETPRVTECIIHHCSAVYDELL